MPKVPIEFRLAFSSCQEDALTDPQDARPVDEARVGVLDEHPIVVATDHATENEVRDLRGS